MLRFAGERTALTGDDEEAPGLSKSADPMLSIIELLKSRTVARVVVDTLGLQLQSWTPEFPTAELVQVHVDPRAAGDTVALEFRDHDVVARRADRTVTAPYGQVINLGVAQFAVRSRPSVDAASLGIVRQEQAIDALLAGLHRHPADRDGRPRRGLFLGRPGERAAIVNTTVQAFQSLNIQWARERSRRRREFLAEQLAQTDSLLARAQAELSSFRSRQQLASSRDKMAAEQNAALALETRTAELDADRKTFNALLAQLKTGDDAASPRPCGRSRPLRP